MRKRPCDVVKFELRAAERTKANVGGVSKRTEGGATRSKTEKKTDAELPEEEVERQRGEPLPDREVMSIVYPQPILPDAELDNLMPNDPIPKDIPKDSI